MKQIIPFKKEITFKTMISKITSISLEHTLELKEEDTITGDFIVSGSYKMTEASQIDEEFSYKVPIEITIDSKYDTSNVSLEIDDFIYEVLDEEKLVLNIDLCIDNLELKTLEVREEKEEEEKVETISSYDEYQELGDTLSAIEEDLKQDSLIREDDNTEEEITEAKHKEEKPVKEERNDDLFLDTSTEEKLEIPININSINNSPNNNPEVMPYSPPSNKTGNSDNNNEENDVSSIFTAFKDTDETFATYCIYIIREGDSLDTVINKYKTTRDILAEYNDLSDIRIGTKIIVPNTNE